MKKGIVAKITGTVVPGVVLFSAMVLALVFLIVDREQKKQLDIEADEMAQHFAEKVGGELSYRMGCLAALSEAASSLVSADDAQKAKSLSDLSYKYRAENPECIEIYFEFERGGLLSSSATSEGKHWSVEAYSNGGKLQTLLQPSYDFNPADTVGEEYYQKPIRLSRPVLVEPSWWKYDWDTTHFYEVSLTAPVFVAGKPVGIVGTDISFQQIDADIKAIRPLGSGWAVLASSKGRVIAHPDSARIDKPVFGADTAEQSAMLKALGSGQAFDCIAKDARSKGRVFFRFVPLHVHGTDDTWIFGVAFPLDVFNAAIIHLRWVSLLAALLMAFGATLLIVLITRNIVKPISAAALAMSDIASGEGDLTRRLPTDSKDEVAELGSAFNSFADKLSGIIHLIAKDSTGLNGTSLDLKHGAKSLDKSAAGIQGDSSGLSDTSGKMSTAVQSISVGAEEMSSTVSTVASAIEEMSTSLSDVASGCQQEAAAIRRADTEAHSAQDMMNQLGRAATEISKIVDTINDISAQTNLLALNATIEAASAGDAGKGFSVVADEVKHLSRQVASATKEIKRQIEEMQEASSGSIASTKRVAEIISEVSGISKGIVVAVERQSETVVEISSNISMASRAASDISKNIAELAVGVSGIHDSTKHLDDEIHKTGDSIKAIHERAENLSDLANNLDTIVKQFKT